MNLKLLFEKLNTAIETENIERRDNSAVTISKAQITILGQTSLLIDEKVSIAIDLAATSDMDALVTAEYFVQQKFSELLKIEGLVLDTDSPYIFLPKNHHFEKIFDFEYICVSKIDAESALVSKAVKAAPKNKELIKDALASGLFSSLRQRIIDEGGDIHFFE